jgi:hypothetical protein
MSEVARREVVGCGEEARGAAARVCCSMLLSRRSTHAAVPAAVIVRCRCCAHCLCACPVCLGAAAGRKGLITPLRPHPAAQATCAASETGPSGSGWPKRTRHSEGVGRPACASPPCPHRPPPPAAAGAPALHLHASALAGPANFRSLGRPLPPSPVPGFSADRRPALLLWAALPHERLLTDRQ